MISTNVSLTVTLLTHHWKLGTIYCKSVAAMSSIFNTTSDGDQIGVRAYYMFLVSWSQTVRRFYRK